MGSMRKGESEGEWEGEIKVEKRDENEAAKEQMETPILQQQQQEEEEDGAREETNRPPLVTDIAAALAQLTIFYGGSISVYDAVPPEKAQAIMFIAAAAAAAAGANTMNAKPPVMPGTHPNAAIPAAVASPVLTRSLSLQSSSSAMGTTGETQQALIISNPNSPLCKLQAELPGARRHSLQRFLEKRRDRIGSRAPYASAKTSDSMAVGLEAKPQLS